MPLLIFGAGGHGQCIADALLRFGREGESVRFLDDRIPPQDHYFARWPVAGDFQARNHYKGADFILGIGDNRRRKKLFEQLVDEGFQPQSVIDPSATIGYGVTVGPGCYIGAQAVIATSSCLGANAIINGAGCLGHHSTVADHAHLGPGVVTARSARIGEGALVGAGTVIKPEANIGEWSVVGSGSLVARDIPEFVVAAGAPARAIKNLRDSTQDVEAQ